MRKTKRATFVLSVCAAALAPFAVSTSAGSTVRFVKEGVQVSESGKLTPNVLPRRGTAPVGISFGGTISSTRQVAPPKLTKLTIELNRHGRLDTQGVPRCRLGRIRPSTTREALAACGSALVGEGRFAANVRIPEQSPFPSQGKVLAFNGRLHGRPAIFAHIYGLRPVPTSYVLPFTIGKAAGEYGVRLETSFPQVTGEWGYVKAISMNLNRRFSDHGKTRGYVNANCPAPRGTTRVPFSLAQATFVFDTGLTIAAPPVSQTCTAKG